MPSSRRLHLSPEASDDLRDLLQYSLEQWGPRQRDTYKAAILRTLRDLARFPGLGRSRDDLGPDLRSFPVGQHLIVYTIRDKELIVVRILHGRRDIATELDA